MAWKKLVIKNINHVRNLYTVEQREKKEKYKHKNVIKFGVFNKSKDVVF